MDYLKERSKWWFGVCYHKKQLDDVINCVDIREYAYILHDKDVLFETGELKKPHYHILVHLSSMQRGSWFKKFGTDDMGQIFVEATRAPKSCLDYLTHKDPKSVKAGKFLYDDKEVVSTFDELENEEKQVEDNSVSVFDDLRAIINHQMTWHQFYLKFPKRLHSSAQYKVAYGLLYEETYGVDFGKMPLTEEKSTNEKKSISEESDLFKKEKVKGKKTIAQITMTEVNEKLPF